MKVVFDTSVLLLLVDPTAKPRDADVEVVRQGSARERLTHLIATLDKRRAVAIVPSPTLTELMINAGPAAGGIPAILAATRRFTVSPFDTKAAIECGLMLAERRKKGKQKDKSWAKVKFDHQIVAIAKTVGAEVVYSDDEDVQKLCNGSDIKVFGVWDLAPPPIEPQYDMNFAPASVDDESNPKE